MDREADNRSGPSQASVEIGVAIASALFGVIVIAGSVRIGTGWGVDGPASGFFPFYIGVAISVGSAINLVHSLRIDRRQMFAEWGQLRQVVSVVIPTAIYVAVVPWIGLYVASLLLIAGFMVLLGGYRLHTAAASAATLIALTYVTFEWWFLVPLPKGLLEDLLGL
jgi:putative tricarboxylic transport membrane protein